ncbi:glycosyltransferase [Cellulomonas fengjieae]|uniref:glycosyltransferase n=1 Tax=Cellulomonas fengjieae TaxID=2819978 RepID=UPI001AB015B1|nr:glycosyl transferase [Cellulomonas fengjieae]MBO3100543.1 glycosyl transferase [Cellulomonas fengjieae]
MAPDRPIRVLQPFEKLLPTANPYIVMLHRALESTSGVEPLFFSYGRALRGGYDVVHLHWPETRLSGRTRPRRIVRRALAFAFLARVRLFRVPIVRTVHNLELPTGMTRLDYLYLRLVDRWTTLRIGLNETTPLPPGTPAVTILLGHYRDWFAGAAHEEAQAGRIGYAGLVRRYKNVEGLVAAFVEAHAQDETLSLVVAGKPSTAELERDVRAAAAGDDAVTFDLRYLDDADLVRVVTSCELVALPFRHMHNSSTILLALSLDRPVLVPRNDANAAIAAEVGPGWIHMFDGDLSGRQLQDAVRAARLPRSDRADLSRRGWAAVGTAHRDAYVRALRARRG